jgi:hypothetical protein
VGPTIPKSLPKAYLANTEKYSSQVRLQELPEGATLVQNYTAGRPFPHPTEPDLGGKLLGTSGTAIFRVSSSQKTFPYC